MKEYTTQEILNGISENDSTIVQYIYDRYFHSIRKFIEKFGGGKDDALDVFQEGIIVIYEQLVSGEIKKINNFRTYFFSICKFKWFNMIRDGKFDEFSTVEMDEILPALEYQKSLESLSGNLEKERRVKVFFNSFMELSNTCRMMIRYVAHGWAIEDIADKTDFSVAYTYRKRQACLNKLIKIVDEKLNTNNL
ncbi:MAG: RNA polymerase sigma factor [Bacteroidota bacterium]